MELVDDPVYHSGKVVFSDVKELADRLMELLILVTAEATKNILILMLSFESDIQAFLE